MKRSFRRHYFQARQAGTVVEDAIHLRGIDLTRFAGARVLASRYEIPAASVREDTRPTEDAAVCGFQLQRRFRLLLNNSICGSLRKS